MNNITDWEKIIVFLDHKPDKVQVVHMDNPSLSVEIPIEVSATGTRTITINNDIFGVEIAPIDVFEDEDVPTRLNSKQEELLYRCWGEGASIMISRTADAVGIEKRIAKELIVLAQRHGILCLSYNNTWKIKNPGIIRSRWIDKATRLQKGPKREEPTNEELIKKSEERHDARFKKKGEEGHDSDSDSEDEEQIEETVQVIPEEPLRNVAIEMLQHRIKELNKLINDSDLIENETNNKHTMISERNKLQVDLRNAEIAQSQRQYTQGTKVNASGSVTRVERVKPIAPIVVSSGGMKNIKRVEGTQAPQSSKKISSKGKPSHTKGVRKK
jgi:hypothetical protein